MIAPMARILIVGGGIVGVASAYFLGKAGFQVHLLEREITLGSLTTAASLQAVRAQFSDPANIAFMKESLAFYETFQEQLHLPGHEIDFHQQGYLFVTSEEATAARQRERVAFQHAHGLDDVEYLEGEELHRRFPYLAAEALAATFRQRDGWVSAHEILLGFKQAAGRYDVHFHLQTEVLHLIARGGRMQGVRTKEAAWEADMVVLAAGPFTAKLARTAEVDLPLAPIRRHRVVIGAHDAIPHWAPMTIDEDAGAHWRPEGPGAALAWAEPEVPSPPQRHVSPDPNFTFRVMEGVYRLNPFWLDVAETLRRDNIFLHAGQYTVSPDHNPLIGPVPDRPGLWVISGFSGHGIMATPASARLLADLITGRAPLDANPYAVDRPSLAEAEGEKMVL
ncbi:MAG TPA: FAD-binding oxidoreductase [Caldilineales bacterium]|nr:FAD-binding oxidoreductase [Caldilineales bacterium]